MRQSPKADSEKKHWAASDGIQTRDHQVASPVLCQLSYRGSPVGRVQIYGNIGKVRVRQGKHIQCTSSLMNRPTLTCTLYPIKYCATQGMKCILFHDFIKKHSSVHEQPQYTWHCTCIHVRVNVYMYGTCMGICTC